MRRPRLEAQVASASIALLSAPAGFGKTATISNSLAEPLVGADRPRACWVQLGSAFRTDALTVVDGLVAAARQFGGDIDTGDIAVDDADELGSRTIERVSEALDLADGSATLVIDNLERATAPLCRSIAEIVSNWSTFDRRVIVATRSSLATFATTWPVHAADVVLTAEDLRFELDEVAMLMGLDLVDHADRVACLSGGWPFALDTVRRSLAVDPGRSVERVLDDLEPVIAAEVLVALDPEDLRLLMTVSLLDSFPRRLVDRIDGASVNAVRLHRLASETGLLTTRDDGFEQIEVFGRALRRRFAVTTPEQVAPAHRRIADAWLDEPNTVEATAQALRHLIDGADHQRALDVIRRRWEVFYVASRIDVIVDAIELISTRLWVDDPGLVLLAGWGNLLIGRTTRALELLQSDPLRTPLGAAIGGIVWAQGVWWSTSPTEAIELVGSGRVVLDALPLDTEFPDLPGNDDAPAFRVVAQGAEARALFMLGDLVGSIERLDDMVERPMQLEAISVVGLRCVAALVRAFRGDRHEALDHLRSADTLGSDIGVTDHYVLVPGALARAVVATLEGADGAAGDALAEAADGASRIGAANLLRLCELVAELLGDQLVLADDRIAPRASRLPLVDGLAVPRAARRLAELGDVEGALRTLRDVEPAELALAPWVQVLLARYPIAEVREWIASRPAPTCAHGQLVRLLVEATVAEASAEGLVRRAAAIASERRLLGVVCDAPCQLWERDEVLTIDLPILFEARDRLANRSVVDHAPRFTQREIELLRLMTESIPASEMAARLYVSVNTVKWHKANIFRKLNVSGTRAALDRAATLGLVDPTVDR